MALKDMGEGLKNEIRDPAAREIISGLTRRIERLKKEARKLRDKKNKKTFASARKLQEIIKRRKKIKGAVRQDGAFLLGQRLKAN